MNKDQSSATWNELVKQEVSELPLEPLPWSKLGRVQVIKNWTDELIELLQSDASLDDWNIAGHAVVIVHDDVDDCRKILQRVAADICFDFTCFNDHFIQDNISGDSISTQCDKATLVYLEPGNWMKNIEEVESEDSGKLRTLQENISLMIKQFDPKLPIVFCTSIEKYEDLSVNFRKQGLFDRRFVVLKPTLEEVGVNFVKMIGEDICSDSFKENLGKIGKLLDIEFDDKRRQELIALALKRIAKRESRKIEFSDLAYLSTKGSAESDDYPKRSDDFERKIAVHEAGHALVAMIDSAGQNIPEYVSILEAEGFFGIVTDSMSYHLAKHKFKSYADIRHQIRVCLAGRVAEHMIYGSENISVVSATDDLRRATELCFYMFSAKGISPDMATFEGACSNLTVELEEDKPFDKKRTELQARDYLAEQYKIVYNMINENKQIYEELLGQLMTKAILDQGDLCKIAENNLVPCLI